VTLSQ